jgi:hypothetical protein
MHFWPSYLISNKLEVADLHLSLSVSSAVPLTLYQTDLEITSYCDDFVGSVPSLRH